MKRKVKLRERKHKMEKEGKFSEMKMGKWKSKKKKG